MLSLRTLWENVVIVGYSVDIDTSNLSKIESRNREN